MSSSANDTGTMCSNMNVINNCNAKTSNVLDNFNVCKDFINLETDAPITAAAMSQLGMESLHDKAESFIPLDILKASREKRRVWLHSHIKNMLANFFMSDEHEIIREKAVLSFLSSKLQLQACTIWPRMVLLAFLHGGGGP